MAPDTLVQRAQVPLGDLLGLRGFELEAVEGVVSGAGRGGGSVMLWSYTHKCEGRGWVNKRGGAKGPGVGRDTCCPCPEGL